MVTSSSSYTDRGYQTKQNNRRKVEVVKVENVKNQEFVTSEQKKVRSTKTGESIRRIDKNHGRTAAVTETQALKEEGKSTVVSGFAGEFTQPQARQLADYTAQVGRIEILRSNQQFGGGQKSYIIGPSSLERLRRGSEQEKLYAGWTTSEILKGEKVITSEQLIIPPKTVFYDTSGTIPAEAVFKGGKTSITNAYGFVGGSGSEGFGSKTTKRTIDFNKYLPYATFGIFGTKKSRQEGKEAVLNISETFGVSSATRVLYSTGKPFRKLIGAPSIEGLEPRRGDVLKAGLVPATFYVGGLKVGGVAISEYSTVRYGVAGLGLFEAGKTIANDSSLSGYIEGVTYGATGVAAIPKYNWLNRNLMKLFPRYVTPESTSIGFIESTTVPISKENLLRFEGMEIKTIHVTPSKLPESFVTTAMPEKAGGMRLRENLLNFYRSAPSGAGDPYAYLGYAGISDGTVSSSSGQVLFGTPKITLLTETLTVTPSPLGRTLRSTNILQVKQGGKTFIPAENLFGASTERQVVTVSKYGDLLPFETEGSLVTTFPKERTFTFYPQRKANILTKAVDLFRKEPLSKESPLFKTLSTSRYYKLDILPAKTTSITPGIESITTTKNVPRLDLPSYNTALEESATSSRSVASSRITITKGYSFPIESSVPSSSRVSLGSYLLSSKISKSTVSSTGISSSLVISSVTSSVPSKISSFTSGSPSSYPSIISIPSRPSSPSFVSSPIISKSSSAPRDYFISTPSYGRKSKIDLDEFGLLFKEKVKKSKRRRLGEPGVYVLPDLASVSATEQENFRRFGGGEAIAPRLTKDIYTKALRAYKGIGTGFIPTEQMRTRRLRI